MAVNAPELGPPVPAGPSFRLLDKDPHPWRSKKLKKTETPRFHDSFIKLATFATLMILWVVFLNFNDRIWYDDSFGPPIVVMFLYCWFIGFPLLVIGYYLLVMGYYISVWTLTVVDYMFRWMEGKINAKGLDLVLSFPPFIIFKPYVEWIRRKAERVESIWLPIGPLLLIIFVCYSFIILLLIKASP
jgi:hypothetical protein